MLRSALILSAGLCFACVAVVPPPPPPVQAAAGPAGPPPHPRLADCDSPLANRVVQLSTPFNVVAFTNCNSNCMNPQSNGNPSSPIYANDIKAAFDIAPVFFQQQLCTVSQIFIIPHDSSGQQPFMWGIRKRSDPSKKYIGISEDVWSAQFPIMQAAPLAAYEQSLFNELVDVTPPLPVTFQANPDPPAAPQNPHALALLDILAHELGHILWWDKDVIHGCEATPVPNGFPKDFFWYSWSAYTFTPRFHNFGQQDRRNQHIGPDLYQVQQDLSRGVGNPYDDLYSIYTGGSASLFSTVAPDEDFVETYKLWVLTDRQWQPANPNRVPLTSLQVSIPNHAPIDMVQQITNPNTKLYQKQQWIPACLPWP